MDNPTIYGVIEKNSRSFLVVRRGDLNGFDCVDFRIYTRGLDGQPEFPTKKGVAIRASLVPQMYDAITAVMGALAEEADAWQYTVEEAKP